MKKAGIVLGEEAFAAISAVEGLVMSAERRAWIDALRREGRTNDQIREALVNDLQTRAAA
jgi:hypothetical protein